MDTYKFSSLVLAFVGNSSKLFAEEEGGNKEASWNMY